MSSIVHLPELKDLALSKQIIVNLEENFKQIHLPIGSFYVHQAIGQKNITVTS